MAGLQGVPTVMERALGLSALGRDSVEKRRGQGGWTRASRWCEHGERRREAAGVSARHRGRRLGDQLGELPEVLDGRGQEELVAGTVRAAQPQPVEAEDALQVGKQHLDLLALPPRGAARVALPDAAGHVPRTLKEGARTLRTGSFGQQRSLRWQTSQSYLLAR